ncbi:transcriptional regulator, AraC family /transcriptional regulator, AraC family with amidase-like domain [Paraburkholderia caballeronis]|uniref:Transcriptional regulator GlxA family, contains an amidase domain and an AraC-type DNA-binding HTH domain n=2 Tax=Paraburkholderia caballeronis TaxID=416943 RepID=A0A1H7PRV4_9BURK|nr:AraC family transcriptional regulator /AraC family transcriptional regulator with amidase-like domain [Paraburkholderia caballeronis]PXX00087.1 AraC family transcriptional regulator /AraC family transcriptional regulator with amidase-like domain [Paraburkholderia caballeronis]RAJ97216.1 AraC family transcriptional regulator /AraC family transcriptional regulator with amidase-like domain [Paraburkholderia caballeronis]SEB69133.1 transcriptional regulator, AraC family /transcriptional regulator
MSMVRLNESAAMPASSASATRSASPRVVAVIAFDRVSPFHLSVPCIVFGDERPEGGVPPFDLRVCAAEAGPLSTTAGFTIAAPHSLDGLADADVVIVPSWRDAAEPPPDALCDALRTAHARGAIVVGLCLGAYVLAHAGLLDGRTATTHWAWADDFAGRFAQVRVDPDVLYIDDGDLLTSAGTAAGLDCCLHLLRRLCGTPAANYVARRLVVPPHRQGNQAQYVQQPLAARGRGTRLSGMLDWIRENLDAPHTLDSLAQRALMSRRTFTRQFRQTTGATVGAWLLGERLTRAQQLLETTDEPIDNVAQRAGFGSAASLRQHFMEAFRTSPSSWRREFRGG